jgi:hypothetical protein
VRGTFYGEWWVWAPEFPTATKANCSPLNKSKWIYFWYCHPVNKHTPPSLNSRLHPRDWCTASAARLHPHNAN